MIQDEKNVFNVLFETVSEGVIVVDSEQKIVAVNISAERMFGYKTKELLYEKLDVLIPQKFRASHGAYVEGFMEQNESRQMGRGRDLYGAQKDGGIFPVEAGLNPLEIGGKSYVMAVVIDISIRKQQELELQELDAELEKKVEERT